MEDVLVVYQSGEGMLTVKEFPGMTADEVIHIHFLAGEELVEDGAFNEKSRLDGIIFWSQKINTDIKVGSFYQSIDGKNECKVLSIAFNKVRIQNIGQKFDYEIPVEKFYDYYKK